MTLKKITRAFAAAALAATLPVAANALNTGAWDLHYSSAPYNLQYITPTQQPGYVTGNEAGIEAIFSIANGLAFDLDVRYLPTQTIVDPALTSIDSGAEWSALIAAGGPIASPTIAMFFIDAINWCGVAVPNIVGCANTPGNQQMLDSDFAAGPSGAELTAHELGHNFGLSHRNDNTALMNPFINGGTALIASEIATIQASPLIQFDRNSQQYYIDIQPFAVVDRTVPIVPAPAPVMLLGSGLLLLGFRRKRA